VEASRRHRDGLLGRKNIRSKFFFTALWVAAIGTIRLCLTSDLWGLSLGLVLGGSTGAVIAFYWRSST
jgi:hypothetical protein